MKSTKRPAQLFESLLFVAFDSRLVSNLWKRPSLLGPAILRRHWGISSSLVENENSFHLRPDSLYISVRCVSDTRLTFSRSSVGDHQIRNLIAQWTSLQCSDARELFECCSKYIYARENSNLQQKMPWGLLLDFRRYREPTLYKQNEFSKCLWQTHGLSIVLLWLD